MAWSFEAGVSLAEQIRRKLREQILMGHYPPGSQFPSVRQLAFQVSVNPNTMQKALTELEDEGLLIGHGTAGRFVTADEIVLEHAREEMHRDCLQKFLCCAREMGIPKEKILRFIAVEVS